MERLPMRVHPNFLVAEFGVANLAVSVLPDDQVRRLQLIVLKLCVELFNFGQIVLNLAVFFISQLVIEN